MNARTILRGFTLIELIIAVGIIGFLTALIIPEINEAREKSRDNERVADLARLEFALEVYFEANGEYPEFDDEVVVIGNGGPLDTLLKPFMGIVPRDPRSNDDPDTYQYVYDTSGECADAVLYAKTMERDYTNANVNTLCPDTIADQSSELAANGAVGAHVVRLGRIYDGGVQVALGDPTEIPIEEEEEEPQGNPPLPGDNSTHTTESGATVTLLEDEYNGHTYYYSDTNISYFDAVALAEELGGHLVTLESQSELDYANDLSTGIVWLGINDIENEGTWVYTHTGEPVTNTNWFSGEPNDWDNGNPGEDCAASYYAWQGGVSKWNDLPCDTMIVKGEGKDYSMGFVIEFDYQE